MKYLLTFIIGMLIVSLLLISQMLQPVLTEAKPAFLHCRQQCYILNRLGSKPVCHTYCR